MRSLPTVVGSPRVSAVVTGERLATGLAAASVVALPLVVPRGPGNSSPVDLFILLATAGMLLWAGASRSRLRMPYAAAMAVTVLAGTLGGLAGPYPGNALLAIAQDLELLIWTAAIVNVARRPEALRTILTAWAWSSIGWAALLIFSVVTGNTAISGITPRLGLRASLTFGDPNVCAYYFILSLMVVAAIRRPRHRLVRSCGYLALVGAQALTGSNGGAVALVVAVAVAVAAAMTRRFGLVPAIAVLFLGVSLALVAVPRVPWEGIQQRAHDSDTFLKDFVGRTGQSAEARETLFGETYALYYDHGVLGGGPGSTKLELAARQAPYVKEAHDDYVAALIERGLLGLAGLFLLGGSVATRVWSVVARPLKPAFADVVPRPACLLGAVAAVAVAGSVYEALHMRHVWALFGVVAALHLFGTDLERKPRWAQA